MFAGDVTADFDGSETLDRNVAKVEGDREVQVLTHHELRFTELDLARNLGQFTAIFVDDDDSHFMRPFGLEPIEFQHDGEMHSQRRGQLFPVTAGDPTR